MKPSREGNYMSDLTLVRAGVLITAHDQPPLFDGAVVVSGERIEAVGAHSELSKKYPHAKASGEKKLLLIPGLINGHGHGRGLTDFQRGALDNTLESWLLDTRKYVPVSTYDDIALSAARLLRSGVTTAMHNHILKDPAAYESEFEEALKAYRDAGMRVQFNPGVRNANPFIYGDNKAFLERLPENIKAVLTTPPPSGSLSGENFVTVVKDLYERSNGPMSRIGFGPLAPQWCTDALLLQIRREAESLQAPIHVHAVQSIFQKTYGLEFLGKTLVQHMHDIGFLGNGVVIGHCVWPTEKDIELLAESGTGVTHHPSCNLRVRNGISPAYHMLQAGVRVGLGLDGKSINDDDDMIQEMKMCYLLHRLPSLELDSPHMSSRQVFKMATETNAALLGFEGEIGRLEPGMKADLVLLDYEKMCYPFVESAHDPVDVLLYRGSGTHVDTVMVNGRVVVEKGKVLTLDEERIGRRLAEAASRPGTEKEKALVSVMDELKKQVIDYYRGWPQKVKPEAYFAVNSRVDGLL
jgi:5-methylthioadenosine/S-adenosylhomocysteine deaminase